MAERLVPAISLKGERCVIHHVSERQLTHLLDFEHRKGEITKQLIDAAEYAGFFTLVDHGISKEEIEAQFAISKAFFDLPAELKGKTPHDPKSNNGWEYKVSNKKKKRKKPRVLRRSLNLNPRFRLNYAQALVHTIRRSHFGFNGTPNGRVMKMCPGSEIQLANSWPNVL